MNRLWNWLPLIGFAIFSSGIATQILRTWTLHQVGDISVTDVIARTMGTFLVLIGMLRTRNRYLIIGCSANTLAMVIYLSQVLGIRFR